MSDSDDAQDLTPLIGNSHSEEEFEGLWGFSFGLAKAPTRTEYNSIAKYIAMLLVSCTIVRWQFLHDALSSDLSKITKQIGLGLVGLTLFLFYRMLEKHGLLKKEYKRVDDNTSYDFED